MSSTHGSSEISIRITRTGKMTYWVKYALDSLEENEKRPIVLHTLPKSPDASGAQSDPSKDASNVTSSSLITVPRLISVVEIIKREYIKLLDTKRSTRLVGLHQYNEIGSLEELGLVSGETDEQRTQRIAMALEGKNFPKQQQSPYMRITLSLHELPELVKKGATYQKPLTRIMSKAAKKRVKANQKKKDQLEQAPADVEMEPS